MDEWKRRPSGRAWEQAEYDLAGVLLLWPEETLTEIRKILCETDFADDTARAIFAAACALQDTGEPLDVVTIQRKAEESGVILNSDRLAAVMQLCVTPANCTATARVVRDGAEERARSEVGLQLANGELGTQEAIDRLLGLTERGRGEDFDPMADLNEFFDRVSEFSTGKKSLFVQTHFQALDEQLAGGLIRAGMYTVAARPGTGKTTFAINLAERVSAHGGKVLYESLEMSKYQIMCRRVSRQSGVGFADIQRGQLDASGWSGMNRAAEKLAKRQFCIQDCFSRMDEIEREAMAFRPDLLVLDHIGLLRLEAARGKRYEDMTEISHRIKRLAKALDRPVIALCQLNRQSEGRGDKRPTMADLRDTGAIEEDSDSVILLHRPAKYMPREEQPGPYERQPLEVMVEKNRHGMTGTVDMTFTGWNVMIWDN